MLSGSIYSPITCSLMPSLGFITALVQAWSKEPNFRGENDCPLHQYIWPTVGHQDAMGKTVVDGHQGEKHFTGHTLYKYTWKHLHQKLGHHHLLKGNHRWATNPGQDPPQKKNNKKRYNCGKKKHWVTRSWTTSSPHHPSKDNGSIFGSEMRWVRVWVMTIILQNPRFWNHLCFRE